MGMSGMYGPADRKESLATLQAASTPDHLLDTGDFYGMGHNELLIGEALESIARDRVLLSVKFGVCAIRRRWAGYDTRRKRQELPCLFLAAAGRRLYRHLPTRSPRSQVPIEDTVGAIADMINAGYVRHIGLSESARKPCGARPQCTHQRFADRVFVDFRGIEDRILPTARELGIALRRTACCRGDSSVPLAQGQRRRG